MSVENFLRDCADFKNAFVVAQLTDEYLADTWSESIRELLNKNAEKILEIRIFNQEKECRLFRLDIGKDFYERTLSDSGENKNCFDEVQYLDIDTDAGRERKGKGDFVISTGGGKYRLPLEDIHDAKVRIRYYLGRYDETGQARVEDWRMVEFI